jgi:prepilin-type N-terminal cleavage/methylation domain-containing protein
MRSSCRNRKGFSLAEAVIATVVLGIAAAGVLLPFMSGVSVRAEGEHRTLGAKLASDLMEEIIKTPFNQIVTSYNYTEFHSNYAKFNREVNCVEVYVPQESGTGEAKFIRATVRVYYKGREIAIINRLISK